MSLSRTRLPGQIMNSRHPTEASAHDRQGRWLALVSGQRRGPVVALARAGLTLLSGLYRVGLAVSNLRFCCASRAAHAPCPVLSVGNLTVGGTGKTPMVAYLANLAKNLGGRPLIVSRGYGRPSVPDSAPAKPNEEARELERLAPGVPHVQNPDRAAAIREWFATADTPADLVILDDGFQHHRLTRSSRAAFCANRSPPSDVPTCW
jgi:tetraacyldisaccharide 4'-kinase